MISEYLITIFFLPIFFVLNNISCCNDTITFFSLSFKHAKAKICDFWLGKSVLYKCVYTLPQN
jgi:hypothetical protein